MRERANKFVHLITVGAIIAMLFFTMTSCSHSSFQDKIIYTRDVTSSYSDVIAEILPAYTLIRDKADDAMFSYLNKGYETDTFDVLAVGALENGVANQWYPQYLATPVIAIDRELTDVKIDSWMDLLTVKENVALSEEQPYQQLIISAISYGLEGENFSLDSAIDLLRSLRQSRRLTLNTVTEPIVICFDYQAAALIKGGRMLEIVVPREGSLTFKKGILSNKELNFSGNEKTSLLAAGFRLPDGSCDPDFYPAADYENTFELKDYSHLSSVGQDVVRAFRRSVLRTRLYSSADNREHQLFPLIYIVIVVVWLTYIVSRTLQNQVKTIFRLIGIVLLGWIIVRLIKYQLTSSLLNRYLWYGFYIFQLALPALLLWLVWRSDKMADRPMFVKGLQALALFNGILIVFVFTNDLHNLVFQLDLKNSANASDYSYGPIFYLITIVWITELAMALITLLVKSNQLPRKTALIFPLIFCLVLLVYAIGYIARIPIFWFSDYTMVVGFLSLFFLEASLQTGLVQGNSKYSDLFAHSPLNMQIINREGQPVLASANAPKFDLKLQQAALATFPSAIQTKEDTLLFSTEIKGGYAQWQEDISSLNSLHRQIEESVKKLELTNTVLEIEEKIRRELDEEDVRVQLMTQLEELIAADLLRLSSMIEGLDSTREEPGENGRIALLLCYIKRRSNLFFRRQESEALAADELIVYIDELAEIAKYAGVKILVNSELKYTVPVQQACLFYELSYKVIDWAAKIKNPHIILQLLREKEQITLRLLSSEDLGSYEPKEELRGAIALADGAYTNKDLDGAVGISLTFWQRGNQDV